MKNDAFSSNIFSSFREVESYIESLNTTVEKGNAFEHFAKYYLLLNKNLYEIENVYTRSEIPIEIKEKLKFELTDYGVDGVIVRNDQKIIAYQAKFRSNRIPPSYRELSTFWTESEYADLRMIITNANSLPRPTQNRRNQLVVMGDDFDLLSTVFFESLHQIARGRVIRTSLAEPRPYQQKIINDVVSHFENHDRGKVIAACGIGKTLISKWIQESLNSKTTLFMAPSLSLIKQTLEEWSTKTKEPISFLAVCSDDTVAEGITEDDDITTTANNINFPVTTNPEEIKNFLINKTDKPKVIFSTYHSVDAISNAVLTMDHFQFDLALYDEAHRTAGAKNTNMFIRALDNEYVPIKKRLFLTATERVVTPRLKKFAETAGVEVFSMDDTQKYGVTFSELNFGNAISQGIIADYKVIVCSMEEEELLNLVSLKENVTLDVEDNEKQAKVEILLKQIILAKAVKELGVKKVISYHHRVKAADDFVHGTNINPNLQDIFAQVNPEIPDFELYTETVSGKMSAGIRKDILNKFANSKYGIVSNAKCLTEGIDVPAIDAIYFADPKSSTVDIIQAIGRALRKSKNKEDKTAYILLPVIFPRNSQGFNGINSETFDTLHSVIQALRDQDNDLAQIIDELNYKNSTGSHSEKKSQDLDLQNKVSMLPNNKIRIEDFEYALQFRISDINRSSTHEERFKPDNRATSIKRLFTSIGDYNVEAFKNNLVLPTVQLFDQNYAVLKTISLKLNNNNISHTSRLGAIEKIDKTGYKLTEIGTYLKHNPDAFESIFQHQLLKYYKTEEGVTIFPYRALFKVFLKLDYIRKFDFVLTIYPLRDTSDENIDNIVEEIRYLQQTYTDKQIMILNEQNKLRLLDVLNDRYNITLGYNDVWTSRGTAYNQFNYFFRHLLTFEDSFSKGSLKHSIQVNQGSRIYLKKLLEDTSAIESLAQNNSEELLFKKYTSLDTSSSFIGS